MTEKDTVERTAENAERGAEGLKRSYPGDWQEVQEAERLMKFWGGLAAREAQAEPPQTALEARRARMEE